MKNNIFLYMVGGSGFKIKYGIKNIGTGIVSDINVSISFDGGLILTGKEYTDSFNTMLPPGEESHRIISPIIGIAGNIVKIDISIPPLTMLQGTIDLNIKGELCLTNYT